MKGRVKVTIIGAGNVGASTAQRMVAQGDADIVLRDIVEGLPQGKALDIQESANILGFNSKITGTNNYTDTADSDLVIITSGLAPGYSVCTWMVGKSTCGSADSGRNLNPTMPASTMATINSAVATGRRMKGRDGFMTRHPSNALAASVYRSWRCRLWRTPMPARSNRRRRIGRRCGRRSCSRRSG